MAYATTTCFGRCIASGEKLGTRICNGFDGRTLITPCATHVVWPVSLNILGSTVKIPETFVLTKRQCLLVGRKMFVIQFELGVCWPHRR